MNRRTFLTAAASSSLLLLADPLSMIESWANTRTQIPFRTATLSWDWSEEGGGKVEEFEIVCGSWRKTIRDPRARSILLRDLLPGPGAYPAGTVVARNPYGKSAERATFPPVLVTSYPRMVVLLS